MRDKKIFILKIVWRKSIASLHRLTQAVQPANLRRTAGDPTWVSGNGLGFPLNLINDGCILMQHLSWERYHTVLVKTSICSPPKWPMIYFCITLLKMIWGSIYIPTWVNSVCLRYANRVQEVVRADATLISIRIRSSWATGKLINYLFNNIWWMHHLDWQSLKISWMTDLQL